MAFFKRKKPSVSEEASSSSHPSTDQKDERNKQSEENSPSPGTRRKNTNQRRSYSRRPSAKPVVEHKDDRKDERSETASSTGTRRKNSQRRSSSRRPPAKPVEEHKEERKDERSETASSSGTRRKSSQRRSYSRRPPAKPVEEHKDEHKDERSQTASSTGTRRKSSQRRSSSRRPSNKPVGEPIDERKNERSETASSTGTRRKSSNQRRSPSQRPSTEPGNERKEERKDTQGDSSKHKIIPSDKRDYASDDFSEEISLSSKAKATRRMIFANEAGYSVAVIADDHQITDFWIEEERTYDKGTSGNIYRGVISRVLPALNAAFVNIGLEKDGFLSLADLSPEQRSQKRPSSSRNRFESALKTGDTVLVQMAKEAIADKGPSLTGKISLPGRFVVYMPDADAIRMSRMLSDKDKTRFRELIKKEFTLKGGLILRTASKGKSISDIQNDLDYLTRTWKRIRQEYEDGDSPKRIHQEIELFERVLRDQFDNDISEIIIDHPRLKHRISSFMKIIAPRSRADDRIKFHTDQDRTVWSKYNLTRDIDQLFTNRVRLNCGGFIIIEEMETLTAIDVNTGKNVTGKTQELTIVETNIEAALEISRQLRLRQIGGIIVVDFIDMRYKKNRDRVYNTFVRELEKDRTPSDIQEFTDLGLIQITRQRSGESLTKRLTYTCPHCHGSGRRPSILLS